MSVLTDIVDPTVAGELINSEEIQAMLAANYAPRVHEAVARNVLAPRAQAQNFQFPQAPSTTITSGSTIAEGEDAEALTAWNPTETTITVATHGIRRAIADQAQFHAVLDIRSEVMMSNINALMDSKDKLVLGQSVNATNQVDKSGLPLDIDVFNTVTQTFKAQNPVMGGNSPAMALHPSQMRDLLESLGSSGAAINANPAMPQALGALFSPFQGGPKEYRGVLLFESANVALADASNYSGFITTVGPNAGLAVVTADWDSNGLGFTMRLTGPESLPANKLQQFVSTYAEYGSGLIQQSNFLEVISRV